MDNIHIIKIKRGKILIYRLILDIYQKPQELTVPLLDFELCGLTFLYFTLPTAVIIIVNLD